jgi:hypothetical protein
MASRYQSSGSGIHPAGDGFEPFHPLAKALEAGGGLSSLPCRRRSSSSLRSSSHPLHPRSAAALRIATPAVPAVASVTSREGSAIAVSSAMAQLLELVLEQVVLVRRDQYDQNQR